MDATAPTNTRMRTATVLVGVALTALAVSAVLFLVPVKNPGVQQCGPPAVFLLQATSDRPLVDNEGSLINGWDADEDADRIRSAQDNRCSARVADRAVPAGILLVVFWVVTVVAVVIGWTGRRSLRRSLES